MLRCIPYNLVKIPSRYAHRQHYAALQLKPSCTTKEIKDAFIRLSKELHPDANVSVTGVSSSTRRQNDRRFIEILEAYKVLSKPDTRAAYDYEQSLHERGNSAAGYGMGNEYRPFYHRPDTSGGQQSNDYYGIKGLKRVSNFSIVVSCAVLMLVGITLQVLAISKSFTFKRQQLDESSRQNAMAHAEVREEAEKYGNKVQIERMKEKMKKERLW